MPSYKLPLESASRLDV